MITVKQVMTREVVTLAPHESLREALDLLQRHHIRHIPVVENGRVIGILTDRDLKRATPSLLSGVTQAEYDRVLDETPLSHVMTRDPLTVTSATPLKKVVGLLIERKIGAIPVVDAGRLIGIVTDIDLLRALDQLLQG